MFSLPVEWLGFLWYTPRLCSVLFWKCDMKKCWSSARIKWTTSAVKKKREQDKWDGWFYWNFYNQLKFKYSSRWCDDVDDYKTRKSNSPIKCFSVYMVRLSKIGNHQKRWKPFAKNNTFFSYKSCNFPVYSMYVLTLMFSYVVEWKKFYFWYPYLSAYTPFFYFYKQKFT